MTSPLLTFWPALTMGRWLMQVPWLENGYSIKVGISEVETIGIVTLDQICHFAFF